VNLHKILLDADNESFAKVFPLVSVRNENKKIVLRKFCE